MKQQLSIPTSMLLNVFCKTGQGGGINPSCSGGVQHGGNISPIRLASLAITAAQDKSSEMGAKEFAAFDRLDGGKFPTEQSRQDHQALVKRWQDAEVKHFRGQYVQVIPDALSKAGVSIEATTKVREEAERYAEKIEKAAQRSRDALTRHHSKKDDESKLDAQEVHAIYSTIRDRYQDHIAIAASRHLAKVRKASKNSPPQVITTENNNNG